MTFGVAIVTATKPVDQIGQVVVSAVALALLARLARRTCQAPASA